MSDSSVKETRRVLRLVQNHLMQANLNLGAVREPIGLVDVIYHPTNTLANLNYVTPRQKTAWVPGDEIERGLDFLREKGYCPRVQYIEGLFPPVFAKTLMGLGLKVERETPLMVYKVAEQARRFKMPPVPREITISHATDQHGIAVWWYVWRNAYYDVQSAGVEPLFVGRDMRELTLGHHVDILVYRYGFPVGVVRLTLHEETAHIAALALMQEVRTMEMTRMLHAAAVNAALERGSKLVFTSGEMERDRRLCRELGFIDSGSIVCYSEGSDEAREEQDASLAQPVFVLR